VIPEQQALLAEAQQSVDAAKVLADTGFHDYAISRAYYAMFYVAEAFLLGKELAFSKHSAVIAGFGQHFIKTGIVPQKFHKYLLAAQEYRLFSDYDIKTNFSKEKALEEIGKAQEFIDLGRATIG
jgi:uncharacterized protein (UPF0332 family)